MKAWEVVLRAPDGARRKTVVVAASRQAARRAALVEERDRKRETAARIAEQKTRKLWEVTLPPAPGEHRRTIKVAESSARDIEEERTPLILTANDARRQVLVQEQVRVRDDPDGGEVPAASQLRVRLVPHPVEEPYAPWEVETVEEPAEPLVSPHAVEVE